jgi:hypothetical protein
MPLQTVERITFGTANLFEMTPGSTSWVRVRALVDVSADYKINMKDAYGEGTWPIASASGHGSITITGKHYTIDPQTLASAVGGTVTTGTSPVALDELYTVPAPSGPYTVALVNGTAAKLVPGTVYILALVNNVAIPYAIVAAGSEVAGKSASVNNATGVVTFASGDAGVTFQASYRYTSTSGSRVSVVNTFQNSQKTMQLVCTKRDASDADSATALQLYTYYAVRAGGMKITHADETYTQYERTYTAYADALGRVWDTDFVNV